MISVRILINCFRIEISFAFICVTYVRFAVPFLEAIAISNLIRERFINGPELAVWIPVKVSVAKRKINK